MSLQHVLKISSLANYLSFSTFPSVYLVYIGISATGECGVVGPTYARLTQSFDPASIHTAIGGYGNWAPLNFTDLFSNCTTREPNEPYPEPFCETQDGSTASQIGGLAGSPSCNAQIYSNALQQSSELKHCYPEIYYPTEGLPAVNSAWSTCKVPAFSPVFDPPRTLGPAAVLALPETPTPTPGPIAGPLLASKTPPPSQPSQATKLGNIVSLKKLKD